MPRPIRHNLDMSADSVNLLLQQLHNKNVELEISAKRDYVEIKKLINSGTPEARAANAVNLETARNNVQKTIKDALSNQKELVKLRLDYVMMQEKIKAGPKGDDDPNGGGAPIEDERAYMRRIAAEMKKESGGN